MLNALQTYYGPLRHTQIIPNGRSPQLYHPVIKEPFVLVAGRLWDEAKNIATLARAASHVRWPIYVAGDSHHPGGGDTCFEHVHTLGRLSSSALAGWLARASIYALPACYKPFGLSALEAALSGCALVLGDIPSLREIWGDTAVFVSPQNERALAKQINQLIENDPERERLAEKVRARALTLTADQMALRYLAAYGQLTPIANKEIYLAHHPLLSFSPL